MVAAISNMYLWKPLRYHPKQASAWRSSSRTVVLCCGRFSGKTTISRRRVTMYLPVKKEWPNPNYFYALPTYGQAQRVAWDPLLSLVPKQWIKDVSVSKMMIETVFGSKLYVLGLDQPARIEGTEWDGGVIDESSDQKPGVYDRSVRPALAARGGWCWRIGVPKRFGPGAVEFKNAFEMGLQREAGYDSYTWPSWEVAPPEEIDALRAQLDTKDFNEQIGGQWVDAGGLAYHAFGEHNMRQVAYNRHRMIWVGSDFNVDPMAWVLGHFVDTPHGKGLEIFDEIWLRNTNTQETLDHLHNRYSAHKGGWGFVGDPAGRQRKTSAVRSDYQQIRADSRFKDAKVRYDKNHPAVRDRLAAVNSLCRNAAGQVRFWVDPSRCPHLVDDLRNRSLDEYGNPMAATPGQRHDSGHATDALGYLVHRYFPISIDTGGTRLVVVSAGK